MVDKDLLWPEMTFANLRRKMKLDQADLDEEADDLNGLTPWEDAFWRGEKLGKKPDRGGSYEA
ncbi:hypothetical protein GF358_01500 [Candidatus Woesearchaeota archaeon]|nr:hypothetical protein [Candidatus Woesearchaeota archaeon]